jgi:hypothetical protein
MRTARTTSRRIAPAGRHERLGPLAGGHRAGRACFLAGLVMALIFGLSGCGAGNGGAPSARPSTEPSGSRPATSGTESPRTTATPPTRPPRTSVATPTTRPPTSVAPPTSDRPPTTPKTSLATTPKTSPATSAAALTPSSTSTPPASGTPAAAESGGLGALGWTLLILLVAGLVAGWLIWRSRRKAAWDGEADALEMETRTATSTQLPSVLTAETPGQRALSWPPLRSGLIDLMRRWDLLADRAFDDQRRNRSVRIRNLLQELVAAVDAENEALATGRDWRLLRPRVDQVGQALSAMLAGMPQQEPAPGGESGRPAPGDDTT